MNTFAIKISKCLRISTLMFTVATILILGFSLFAMPTVEVYQKLGNHVFELMSFYGISTSLVMSVIVSTTSVNLRRVYIVIAFQIFLLGITVNVALSLLEVVASVVVMLMVVIGKKYYPHFNRRCLYIISVILYFATLFCTEIIWSVFADEEYVLLEDTCILLCYSVISVSALYGIAQISVSKRLISQIDNWFK